jgi:glutathione S-transferase
MSNLPVLYSFRRCPYDMRARMAVAISGVKVELREVVLRAKPAEMLEISPKATVPVLVLPNGDVIDESLDVMHWSLAQNDPEGWLSRVDTDLIASNDGPFKAALDRYKYPHRYELQDGIEHRQKGEAFLAELEARLSKKAYLSGDSTGFTDIAIFPFIRQFAATDQAWFVAQPFNALQNWLIKLIDSQLFERIMIRYPRWHANDPVIVFS